MLKSVYIQTNTLCNSRCIICPYKDTYAGKRVGRMSYDLAIKIFKDLGEDYEGEIGFYFQYEPLMDSRLPEFLKLARWECPKSRITISTNAQLLVKNWQKQLIDSPLDCVYFNVLGGTKKTYEKIMHPLNWETTIKNINEFAKKFKGSMFINYIKIKENKKEIGALMKVLPNNIGFITEYWASDRNKRIKINKPKGAKTRFVTDHNCNVIGKGLYIYYDGKVPLCCEIWDREVIIGDVKKQNLYNIFNSPKKHTRYDVCKECLMQ